ncbi:hypothetical protein CHU_2966 [Cytophaga hutchinsonii ATCC 33406]|uniref:Uncharacterized protein n=2 Tax=Cytophaga hutchinsonii TaxID=985 RepID=A0A6N4SVD7_CYTH3|nr:hypothetical protein CHU_2966 [Cytophaga hutchinsonii ATCC 33406]
MVTFLYNVKTIEDYKESLEYQLFKNKFGDILKENVLIGDNKEFIQPNANILLSIAQHTPSKEGFEMLLKYCLALFDISYRYNNRIRKHILDSYPKNKETILIHNIVIINDFEEDQQHIEFYFDTLKKKKSRLYSFLTQTIMPQ